MKKFIFIVLVALIWGCDDFLEEKSQSEIRPTTVKDMEKLLEGEAYFTMYEGPVFNTETDIFTDDWKCNMLNIPKSYLDKKLKDRYHFMWDPLMFEEEGGGLDMTFWTVPYNRIKGCNVILEYMDEMSGDEVKKVHLLGEAYTLRGFYYLMLVNFFGLPYNEGNPAEHLGVPLKLVSGVTDEKFKRNSVAECYAQIEKDLLKGAKLMEQGKEKVSALNKRLNYLAGYALLSRMYLYLEDWENVLKCSDLVLNVKNDLVDMRLSNVGVYEGSSPEILWGGACQWYESGNSVKYPYTISGELVGVYQEDVNNAIVDIRGDYINKRRATFLKYGREDIYSDPFTFDHSDYWVSFVFKCNNTFDPVCGGIRVAEMYLNRAEAYIRKYMETGNVEDAKKALEDLNELRRHRFEDGYVDKKISDFTTREELLAFCLRERRRELCGEGNHRWFDLRRTGMPEIKHIYLDENGGQATEYVLEKGDRRYALPIPKEVLKRNSGLVQNN